MAIRVFGLTGGMGSGKSTVAARFRARGLPVLDADLLARRVLEPGAPALQEIALAFGADLIGADGSLDRRGLAERAFADPVARARLEAITHPRVRALAQTGFEELEARGDPLACYDVPLLFEAGLDARYRPVVVVSTPESLAVARASARSGLDPAEVRARLRVQMPLEDKVRRADHVIDNSGPLAATLEQADAVLDAVCRELGVDPKRYPPLAIVGGGRPSGGPLAPG